MSILSEEFTALVAEPVAEALKTEVARQRLGAEEPNYLCLSFAAITALAETLADAGFHLIPPGMVRLPASRLEAQAMNLVSEQYLSSAKPAPEAATGTSHETPPTSAKNAQVPRPEAGGGE